jgi:hypothetical protein
MAQLTKSTTRHRKVKACRLFPLSKVLSSYKFNLRYLTPWASATGGQSTTYTRFEKSFFRTRSSRGIIRLRQVLVGSKKRALLFNNITNDNRQTTRLELQPSDILKSKFIYGNITNVRIAGLSYMSEIRDLISYNA